VSAELLKAINNCPGLRIGDTGLIWRDVLGRDHELATAKRITLGDAATRLGCDESTVRNRIASRQIYPVVRFSARSVEVYSVAVTDYITRATLKGAVAKEVPSV